MKVYRVERHVTSDDYNRYLVNCESEFLKKGYLFPRHTSNVYSYESSHSKCNTFGGWENCIEGKFFFFSFIDAFSFASYEKQRLAYYYNSAPPETFEIFEWDIPEELLIKYIGCAQYKLLDACCIWFAAEACIPNIKLHNSLAKNIDPNYEEIYNEVFRAKEPNKGFIAWNDYYGGHRLSTLAQEFNISLSELLEMNDIRREIIMGEVLRVSKTAHSTRQSFPDDELISKILADVPFKKKDFSKEKGVLSTIFELKDNPLFLCGYTRDEYQAMKDLVRKAENYILGRRIPQVGSALYDTTPACYVQNNGSIPNIREKLKEYDTRKAIFDYYTGSLLKTREREEEFKGRVLEYKKR